MWSKVSCLRKQFVGLRPGLEPPTFRPEVQRANHYTPRIHMYMIYSKQSVSCKSLASDYLLAIKIPQDFWQLLLVVLMFVSNIMESNDPPLPSSPSLLLVL